MQFLYLSRSPPSRRLLSPARCSCHPPVSFAYVEKRHSPYPTAPWLFRFSRNEKQISQTFHISAESKQRWHHWPLQQSRGFREDNESKKNLEIRVRGWEGRDEMSLRRLMWILMSRNSSKVTPFSLSRRWTTSTLSGSRSCLLPRSIQHKCIIESRKGKEMGRNMDGKENKEWITSATRSRSWRPSPGRRRGSELRWDAGNFLGAQNRVCDDR